LEIPGTIPRSSRVSLFGLSRYEPLWAVEGQEPRLGYHPVSIAAMFSDTEIKKKSHLTDIKLKNHQLSTLRLISQSKLISYRLRTPREGSYGFQFKNLKPPKTRNLTAKPYSAGLKTLIFIPLRWSRVRLSHDHIEEHNRLGGVAWMLWCPQPVPTLSIILFWSVSAFWCAFFNPDWYLIRKPKVNRADYLKTNYKS
jgi:hypothetical protein